MEVDQVTPPVEDKGKLSDSQKDAIITFVESMVDVLNFKRVLLIGLAGLIMLVLTSLFEHRAGVMEWVMGHIGQTEEMVIAGGEWTLSDRSKTELKRLVDSTLINMVSVTEVDLRKNSRQVRYTLIDSSIPIDMQSPKIRSLRAAPQSVYDYDAKNTVQMVAILANEFRCDNYADTVYFKLIPEGSPYISTICRLAIPPFVGQFVGYLSVGLERQPTKQELDSIRLEVSRIAVEIYLSDVVKQTPQ